MTAYRAAEQGLCAWRGGGHFTIKPIADMNMARQIHMFYRPEFRGAELLGDVQKLYYEVMSE